MARAFAGTVAVRKGEGTLDLFRQIGDCNRMTTARVRAIGTFWIITG
jgi:hypothetical protein